MRLYAPAADPSPVRTGAGNRRTASCDGTDELRYDGAHPGSVERCCELRRRRGGSHTCP